MPCKTISAVCLPAAMAPAPFPTVCIAR